MQNKTYYSVAYITYISLALTHQANVLVHLSHGNNVWDTVCWAPDHLFHVCHNFYVVFGLVQDCDISTEQWRYHSLALSHGCILCNAYWISWCSIWHICFEYVSPISLLVMWSRGRFKNTYELLNLRVLKFLPTDKIYIFQCMVKIFCVDFQRYPLKFHTNLLPMHWKIWFLYDIEISRALRFKSSYAS